MTEDRPATPSRPDRAGWFDDPDEPEQLRYFDGILWTDHTTPRRTRWAPTASPEVSASTAPAGAEPPLGSAGPSAGPAAGPSAGATGPYGYPRSPGGTGPGTAAPQQWPAAQPARTDSSGGAGSPSRLPAAEADPTTADGVPLASLSSRFAAWLLDSLVTWTVSVVVGGPLLWLGLGNYPELVAEAVRTGSADANALAEQVRFDLFWIGAFAVLQLAIGVGYHTLFLSRRGATPGKAVVGISVRLAERPGVLSGADALRRSVLRPVLWLFVYTPLLSLVAMPLSVFDAISALWHPQRQTLHDRIGRTVVVRGGQERRPREPA